MKATWTLIFGACIAATIAIAWLLVPIALHNDKFWLSTGAIVLGLVLLFYALVFAPAPPGEQGSSAARFQTHAAGWIYLLATLGLAGIAVTPIGFRFLLALHVLAILAWVVLTASASISASALKSADEKK